MAESSFFSWTTDGTGDGTLTGYTQAQWTSLWRMLYLSDTADEGVFNNYLNELAVTNPSGRDLSINTGGAIVYGFPYINSAAVTKTLTHPVVGTTGWRLVLRADWTAQTVRITLLESADGTATIPAMTQTANTTWDVPLAEGTITTGDVIAITDARVFVHPNIEVENAMMAANSVDSDQYVDGSIYPEHIANRTRTLWVSAIGGYNNTDGTALTGASYIGRRGWELTDGKNISIYGNFTVPSDFVSTMTVTPIVVTLAAGNVYAYNEAYYGAVGQSTATHNNVSAYAAVAVTGTVAYDEGHEALALSSVAAGDYVSLVYIRDAVSASDTVNNAMYFVGWLVSYTADS